jgi:hypothetical protein
MLETWEVISCQDVLVATVVERKKVLFLQVPAKHVMELEESVLGAQNVMEVERVACGVAVVPVTEAV